MDAISTVRKIFDDGVASTPLNAECVTTTLTPNLVFATTTNQKILTTTPIDEVIPLLSVELVGSLIASHHVVTGSSINIFN